MTGVVLLSLSTRPCESMHSHAWTFTQEVIIILMFLFEEKNWLILIFSETTKASNFKIQQGIALGSTCIFTENDITGYFRSAPNRTSVFILDHVRVAVSRRRFNRFWKRLQFYRNCGKRSLFFLGNLDMFAPWPWKWGSDWPTRYVDVW